MAVARAATARTAWRSPRLRSGARCVAGSPRAPWRPARRRTAGRSRCSHLPSILPGALAFTSSRTACDVCSATVLGGLARLRALHQASQLSGLRAPHVVSSRFTSRAASSRVCSRSTRSDTPASREEARRAMAVARAATVRTPWRSPRLRSGARCVAGSPRAPWRPARRRTAGRSRCSHPPGPAGSIRAHVVANGARRVLGDRARRSRATACIGSGVAALGAPRPACRRLAVHIARRELAGLFEEHAKRYARFEGRGSAHDGRGSRRDRGRRGDRRVCARSRGRQSSRAPWRPARTCATARSRCSHLPSILPGAFAFTSSRTACDVCSATVLGGLSRLRALHQAHAGALIARRGARADASLAAHAPHVRPRVRVSCRLSRDRW